MKKQLAPFNWIPIEVELQYIQKTPTNYKIKNALGRERLNEMLKMFGLAGTVVCNWLGNVGDIKKLILIDGNSRKEQEESKGRKKMWVSLPDRKLSPSEFKTMSALFDAASAGDVDYERINGDLGKTKDFYDRFSLSVPKHLLDKLGAKQVKTYEKEKAGKKKDAKVSADKNLNNVVQITLMYNPVDAEKFRKMENGVAKHFGTKDVHSTTFKAMEKVCKTLKIK